MREKSDWLTTSDWGMRKDLSEDVTFKLTIKYTKGSGHEKTGKPCVQYPRHRKQVLAWRTGKGMMGEELAAWEGPGHVGLSRPGKDFGFPITCNGEVLGVGGRLQQGSGMMRFVFKEHWLHLRNGLKRTREGAATMRWLLADIQASIVVAALDREEGGVGMCPQSVERT